MCRSEESGGRPPDDRTVDRRLVVVLVVLGVAVLLYSVLIHESLLALGYLLVPFAFLYLFWRLVRAVERIAAARERSAGE